MFSTEKNEKSYSTYIHTTNVIVVYRQPLSHLISKKKEGKGSEYSSNNGEVTLGALNEYHKNNAIRVSH